MWMECLGHAPTGWVQSSSGGLLVSLVRSKRKVRRTPRLDHPDNAKVPWVWLSFFGIPNDLKKVGDCERYTGST